MGRRAFYPAFVLGRAGLLIWLLATHGAGFPPALLGFTVGSFALLLLAERWIPHRADWSVRGDPQLPNDLGHSVAYVLASGPVAQLLALWVAAIVAGSGPATAGPWPHAWPRATEIVLVIVLWDLLEYWFHRLTHRVSWLWPVHVLHHTPDRLHTMKTLRQHWSYALLRAAAVSVPLVLAGVPLEVLAWGPVGLAIVGAPAHANVDTPLPRWVHRLVNTPQVHRIHHSLDTAQGQSNFCLVLPVWDMLFGTWEALGAPVRATGVRDDPVPSGFLRQLALPLGRRAGTRPESGLPARTR